MTISRNTLAHALADDLTTHLAGPIPDAVVYLGAVGTLPDGTTYPVPTITASDGRVVPYVVVYPSPGIPSDDRPLDDERGIDLLWTWQVTTAAGYPTDHLNLLDVVTDLCDGWAPDVDDLDAEGATQVNDPGPQRHDDTRAPVRFYLPLTYAQLITT